MNEYIGAYEDEYETLYINIIKANNEEEARVKFVDFVRNDDVDVDANEVFIELISNLDIIK